MEELGELAEAYLGVTSSNNGKNKTWSDVREEIVDVLIVSLDLALTPLPGEVGTGTLDLILDTLRMRPSDDIPGLAFDVNRQLSIAFSVFPHSPSIVRGKLNLLAVYAMELSMSTTPGHDGLEIHEFMDSLVSLVRIKLDKWEMKRRIGFCSTDR